VHGVYTRCVHLTEHHVFLLRRLLNHLAYLEAEIDLFSQRIDKCLRPFLSAEQMERLDRIPGVNRRTVENVVAEIGVDMTQYPDETHLSSWAGMCPGHEESAGADGGGLGGEPHQAQLSGQAVSALGRAAGQEARRGGRGS
jgi:transposase